MSSEEIDRIVNNSFIPIKVKTKLKALKKINYYFLLKNEYIMHSKNPLEIIKLIQLCQRHKVVHVDYDIFIEEKNIQNIIKNNSYKSWELHSIKYSKVFMELGLQAYLRRKGNKDLAKEEY